ncbi:MAG: ABC transporter ATP-binding protein [Proteobacteria bacterium]|nr:ABC transporter ATP-binding protein [Pseudomonadota bacterium]
MQVNFPTENVPPDAFCCAEISPVGAICDNIGQQPVGIVLATSPDEPGSREWIVSSPKLGNAFGPCERGLALLEIIGVTRSFYGVSALNGVSFSVGGAGITGLIGPNGAGKTTLFNCISGVIPPDDGRIVFDATDIAGRRPDQITNVGLVRTFQIARGLQRMSVLDNLLLYGSGQPGERIWPALLRTRASVEREETLLARAVAIAGRLNLTRVIHNPASDLSGGQKKLLEIGRALMAEPKMLLLDEPVAGVNPTLAREIGEHLQVLAREGLPILLIEHHMDMVARLCDRVVVMAEGRHLADGPFEKVANDARVQEAYMGRRWRSAG